MSHTETTTIVDNQLHRSLFSLPPLCPSEQTLPAVPTLPPKQRVTGDKEVDAVLWLREVIGTGDATLIAQAQEAAKKIRTPLKELEERYTEHLRAANPGNVFAALSSFGFADLHGLAERSIKHRALQVEAQGRFGTEEALFETTQAEAFCVSALDGLQRQGSLKQFDKDEANTGFRWHPAGMPHTLADCLHELTYWDRLSSLRHAVCRDCGEFHEEVYARRDFVRSLLAEIPPRTREEARAVLDYIFEEERDFLTDKKPVFANLIG